MNTNTETRIVGKDELDIEKIRAEITSLLESSRKMQVETKWHPLWVGAAIFGAGAALATALATAIAGIVKMFLS